MVAAERNRRPGKSARRTWFARFRPPFVGALQRFVSPRRQRGPSTGLVSRWRNPQPAPAPDVFLPRLEALAAQGRTIGYLLQSCISQVDALLGHPIGSVEPPPPNAMPAAGRRSVQRRRHPRHGPVTARQGIPALIALTLVAPIILLATGYSGAMVYERYVNDFVPPEGASINAPSRGARIYDRNGELLYEFVDDRIGVRIPIPLSEVADTYIAATIATEDDSFYANPGINPRGIARAAWENFNPLFGSDDPFEGSGGSSITQQLVKNVYIEPEERAERTVDRKLKEAAFAIELTGRYTKDQILDWYMNQISYGGLYNGVEAASLGYFGKPAKDLSLSEAALLAGIPQSPAAYDPRNQPEAARSRRNEVLDIMARTQRIQIGPDRYFDVDQAAIEAAKAQPLEVLPQVFPIKAPHFVLEHVTPRLVALVGRDALLHDGLVVTTSLDFHLQTEAQDILERWIREFEDISNSRNGALIVLDAPTGEIRAWIGSRDYFREDIDGEVDNLAALNSPGSSFKPFVYLASFLKLGWTPSTLLEDTPVTYREADGTLFQPRNPNRTSYLGQVTIRTALGNSLNVPPFKTALRLGIPAILEVARKVGFTTLHGQYGPAISIGGVDLSPQDLTYAYSVLANNGAMVGASAIIPHRDGERTIDPIAILRVEDARGNVLYDVEEHRRREQVVPAEQAYMVTSILADPSAQCVTFGCGGISVPGRQAAVKTGTSEPFDPNGPDANKIGETWAFGYTPDVVVGVWAGNSDNAPIVNIFSTSISFRVMRDTLQLAHNNQPSANFARPPGIEERRVCTSESSCRIDLFVRGTGPGPSATPSSQTTPAAPQTPTQVMAAISAPTGRVSGTVPIIGQAFSPAMQNYRLEYGIGPAPTTWRSIGQWSTPVFGGTLGLWNTTGLPTGQYAVRVVVQDRVGGSYASPAMIVTIGP